MQSRLQISVSLASELGPFSVQGPVACKIALWSHPGRTCPVGDKVSDIGVPQWHCLCAMIQSLLGALSRASQLAEAYLASAHAAEVSARVMKLERSRSTMGAAMLRDLQLGNATVTPFWFGFVTFMKVIPMMLLIFFWLSGRARTIQHQACM